MSTANKRRYRALMARAADQRDTPEGETSARLAAAMLAQHPELKGAELPEERREYTWESEVSRIVLGWVIEAQGIEAKERTEVDEQVLMVDATAPVHDLIARRYEALRKPCEELVNGVMLAFLQAAVPNPELDKVADAQASKAPTRPLRRTAGELAVQAIGRMVYQYGVLQGQAMALGESGGAA